MARPCEDASTTTSTPAFLALPAERRYCKNCCEMLTVESQCSLELAAEEKQIREKLAEREEADAALKTTPDGWKKRLNAADNHVASP